MLWGGVSEGVRASASAAGVRAMLVGILSLLAHSSQLPNFTGVRLQGTTRRAHMSGVRPTLKRLRAGGESSRGRWVWYCCIPIKVNAPSHVDDVRQPLSTYDDASDTDGEMDVRPENPMSPEQIAFMRAHLFSFDIP